MTWADFYLVCFLVGFLLSILSLLLGQLDLNFHADVHGDLPHIHLGGHDLAGHDVGGHGGGNGGGNGGHGGGGHGVQSHVSPFNFATMAAFLAWFGGTGYLFARYSSFVAMASLGAAIAFGLAGALLVFWFLGKLVTREENMDPSDYDMVGVLGQVVSGIHAGGTGEIVYVQGETRHACGARSEDGAPIAKGEEVVVTRYDKGIAYVRRWDELTEESAAASADKP